ncbi:hypothetical protein PgNI_10169 [Pyricularia grisea]|uniref:Uncharacterized protein n=1 Tax=Pyricularia grisea TaxID=148305 RepID=A0A6P8AYK4_PYRGI|nr:hypothetical protein PgNI_10169 [Pyricularia grisea]TLD07351.1 hypothetical protein PgNI_10169 [Pyricularia grisea]
MDTSEAGDIQPLIRRWEQNMLVNADSLHNASRHAQHPCVAKKARHLRTGPTDRAGNSQDEDAGNWVDKGGDGDGAAAGAREEHEVAIEHIGVLGSSGAVGASM